MVLCISILYYWELLITVVVLPNFSLKYLYMFYCNTCVCVPLPDITVFIFVCRCECPKHSGIFSTTVSLFKGMVCKFFFPSPIFLCMIETTNQWNFVLWEVDVIIGFGFFFWFLFVLLILALESVSYHIIHRRKANVYLLPFFHS